MAIHTPPSWLQNGSHPAENDRLTTQALWATTGIISPSSLAVTANGPANMSVNVASGWCAIVGTIQPNMGTYVAFNDATVNLVIAAANPTNPRIDVVCVTVNDSYYTGSTDNVVIQVITGTPAGSPVAPSIPANSIALANVAVAAGALSITSGNITDQRVSVTTNLPIGDITGVTAGTGLTGGGTSGTVSLAIDTSVTADLSTTQTLTNKTLTSPKINVGVNPQSGTSYPTVAADNGKLITTSNSSAVTITITTGYAQGAQISVAQMGTGQVTVQGDTGVTIVSTGATAAAPKTRTTYSTLTAICTDAGSNTWIVAGDIA